MADALSYHSSTVEAEWFPPAKPACSAVNPTTMPCDTQLGPNCCPYRNGKVCNISARLSQTNKTPEWLIFANASRGPAPREPTVDEATVISRLEGHGGCSEYIEPLTGLGRHPLAPSLGCRDRGNTRIKQLVPPALLKGLTKYSIGHLILANRCNGSGISGVGHQGRCRRESIRGSTHGSRTLFYDLGCSIYGTAKKHMQGASGQGTSIQIFSAMYQRNCLPFDSIWAWEAKQYDPSLWWKPVPFSTRAKIHFYNIPVDFDGFVATLKASARPSDFVVVKIDIDGNAELERRIAQAIAHTPELASLVDELFFEYHVHWDGGHNPWHHPPPWAPGAQSHNQSLPYYFEPDSIDDALKLMRELREAGVRSHFWV